jgi:hypothetical protein
MPTDTDVKLASDLADFRLEVSERFGRMDARFASIETELSLIRKLGDRLLGAMAGGVGAMVVWAALAGWYGSSINSDVRQQAAALENNAKLIEGLAGRVGQVEKRLDSMDSKLDLLVRRGEAPKGKGGE